MTHPSSPAIFSSPAENSPIRPCYWRGNTNTSHPIINALLSSYFPQGGGIAAPAWPDDGYDTIWTVTLDAKGNLTVNNALCEGIDSAKLPDTAPHF